MRKYDKKVVVMDSTLGMLLVAFIVLKLTGVIAWGWFWVLSPLWMPFAILFGFLGIAFAGVCVFGALSFIVTKAKKAN